MICDYEDKNQAACVREAFRGGHALSLPWNARAGELIRASMATVAEYLAAFPPAPSFGGINNLDADRQTLWVASTGLNNKLHLRPEELTGFDGDTEGGREGLKVLQDDGHVASSIQQLKNALDKALQVAVDGLGLSDEVHGAVFGKTTVRYRAIRYAPIERQIAGIGLHPDGNVLSALITDQPGLLVVDQDGQHRPSADATIVMPGSILYRWSKGYFKPTFHTVEIGRGDPAKFTIVAFLNFPDHTDIPRSTRLGHSGHFRNDVQGCKEDDMNRGGDLASEWRLLTNSASSF